jgi:hypothetical protein
MEVIRFSETSRSHPTVTQCKNFQNRIDGDGMLTVEPEVAGGKPVAGVHCKSHMDWPGIEPQIFALRDH